METTRVTFGRLSEVPTRELVALLDEPRNRRHLPLAGAEVRTTSPAAALRWARDKDAQWEVNGYGPWAVHLDGAFAGWGGLQHEEYGPDLALVLSPRFWGHGRLVVQALLRRATTDLELSEVFVAVPLTRSGTRTLARLGFAAAGRHDHQGVAFDLYRLALPGIRGETPRTQEPATSSRVTSSGPPLP